MPQDPEFSDSLPYVPRTRMIGGGSTLLGALSDVNAGSPSDNEVLAWDSATSKWINQDLHARVLEIHASKPAGAVSVETGTHRIYNKSGKTRTLVNIVISVDTAPTDADLEVDVNIDGTTIFTTQTARPIIAASGFVDTSGTPAVTAWLEGEYIQIDVDQVGSTEPGQDLVVTIRYTEAF